MQNIKQNTVIRCLINTSEGINIFLNKIFENKGMQFLCISDPTLNLFNISFLKRFTVHVIFKRKYRGKKFCK